MWPEVDRLSNGDNVDAETLNKPINQLASRTDTIRADLDKIGNKSAVILTGVQVSTDDDYAPDVGQAVYYYSDGEKSEFRKAQASMDIYGDFKASDPSAFTVGILTSVHNGIGDVYTYGKAPLKRVNKETMLQSGEKFRSGRYYLSATEPGKLTAYPSGPLIYVGTFQSNGNDQATDFNDESVAFINPQFLDIGTSHVHRAYPLVARPAGSLNGSDVIGYLPVGSEPLNTLSSGPAGSSSAAEISAPSLIFGGTWTSTNDVVYRFSLLGNEWGGVKLSWTRNGVSKDEYSSDIPAPGVFVSVDDGLLVKVLFPNANSSEAYPCGTEYVWDPLVFPYAGKGWINHAVNATASTDGSRVRAEISGSWQDGSTCTVMFRKDAYVRTFTDLKDEDDVTIGTTTYKFSQSPESSTDVQLAATVEESLRNLATLFNGEDTPSLFYRDGLLLSCYEPISGGSPVEHDPVDADETGFDVVGGKIPVLIAYGDEFRLWGSPVSDVDCYRTVKIGTLSVTVYAPNATKNTNNVHVTFDEDLRLFAKANDYEPKAKYDYVMGLHQEVDYYFPPVPAKSAGMFVNGVELENKALFPVNPTYSIGHSTIHWMDDKFSRLPWPHGISGHDDPVLPKDDKTIAFYFNVGFQCANGPVTSLVPVPGSNVKLYTHGTNDVAYTGDLMIDVACDFEVADNGLPGYIVPKQGRNGKLLAGAVVEKVKAGPGILVTQKSGCPSGQGTVTVSLDNGSLGGHFTEIALENAKQEKIGLFPYVSLLGWNTSGTNIPSAFTAMMRVPTTIGQSEEYKLQVKAVVFGTSSYGPSDKRLAAGLQFEYNILPDYTGDVHRSLKNGLIIPDTPRKVALPFGHETSPGSWTYSAFDPFVVMTDNGQEDIPDVRMKSLQGAIPQASEFTQEIGNLKPGYLVAIRFSRTDNPDPSGYDSYVGGVGFLSLEWNLEEA